MGSGRHGESFRRGASWGSDARRGRGLELVPEAVDGLDEALATGFQFSAQRRDVYVHVPLEPLEVVPKRLLDQLRAGKYLSGRLGESPDQVELGWGQADRLAVDLGLEAARVQRQRS